MCYVLYGDDLSTLYFLQVFTMMVAFSTCSYNLFNSYLFQSSCSSTYFVIWYFYEYLIFWVWCWFCRCGDIWLLNYFCQILSVNIPVYIFLAYFIIFFVCINSAIYDSILFDPGRCYCYWDSIKPCKSNEFRLVAYGSVTRG